MNTTLEHNCTILRKVEENGKGGQDPLRVVQTEKKSEHENESVELITTYWSQLDGVFSGGNKKWFRKSEMMRSKSY